MTSYVSSISAFAIEAPEEGREVEQVIWTCREVSSNGSHSWDWMKDQSASLAPRV